MLAIRLQAVGDVAITLPYLRAVSRRAGVRLDFLTREDIADLPRGAGLFDRVFTLGGGRSERAHLLRVPLLLPSLLGRRYEVVLDLQNNRVSRAIRRALAPRAWSAFDRESPVAAGERTRRAIQSAGVPLPSVDARLPGVDPSIGDVVLRAAGWIPDRELVVMSPAGAFPTRNWPVDRYARFAEIWSARRPAAQFAVLGLPSLRPKSDALRLRAGDRVIDLTGQTSLAQALAIVQRATLVLSEDCGLMHMAWVSGVPTLALFGSSRHVWSAPLGPHTRCLHSGDLECGACMEPSCRFGDVRCLARYSPEQVVEEAERLLERAAVCGRALVPDIAGV
jgi:ADP-heptose:LPS heptosyltransferase